MSLGKLRSMVDNIVTLAGVVIVLAQVLFMATTRVQGTVILLGLFLIIVGTWRLASRMLPERREFGKLRQEVNRFMELVPQIHFHAVADNRQQVEEIKAEMHASVDRMGGVAGEPDRPE